MKALNFHVFIKLKKKKTNNPTRFWNVVIKSRPGNRCSSYILSPIFHHVTTVRILYNIYKLPGKCTAHRFPSPLPSDNTII